MRYIAKAIENGISLVYIFDLDSLKKNGYRYQQKHVVSFSITPRQLPHVQEKKINISHEIISQVQYISGTHFMLVSHLHSISHLYILYMLWQFFICFTWLENQYILEAIIAIDHCSNINHKLCKVHRKTHSNR